MKVPVLFAAVLIYCVSTAVIAAEVGVLIEGAPEYYGEVDIKAVPDPWLVYEQPVVIEPNAASAKAAPIYLYVPGDHHRRWFKHCHDYNACDLPVYFVKENWYKKVYVPAYYKDRGKPTARPVIILPAHGRRY